MKEIKIKYSEYVLPENPNIFNKIGKFGDELLGTKLYSEDKTFTIKVENPDLFLSNNKSFAVKNESFFGKIEPDEKADSESKIEETIFDIQKWNYKFNSNDEYEFVAFARKRKESQLDALYASMSDKWQMLFPFFTILILAATGFFAYALTSDYPNPLLFWSAIGKYIQPTVSWGLFLLMFGLLIWSAAIYRGSVILKSFVAAASSLLMIILPIFWVTVSVKPAEFAGQPDEHILYLNYLRNYFSTTSLIFIGIVPWITIFLKYFGFELLPALLSQATKDKSK